MDLDPTTVADVCPDCGRGPVRVRYVNEWLWLTCDACGAHVADARVPSEVAEARDGRGLLAAVDRRRRRQADLAAGGTCWRCLGPVERRVGEFSWGPDSWTRLHFRCADCDHRISPVLGLYLLDHPDVVSFYVDAGVDVTGRPHWHVGAAARDRFVATVAADPWRFEVTFPAPEGALVATVSGDLDVVATERRPTETFDAGYPPVDVPTTGAGSSGEGVRTDD